MQNILFHIVEHGDIKAGECTLVVVKWNRLIKIDLNKMVTELNSFVQLTDESKIRKNNSPNSINEMTHFDDDI